MVTTIGYCAFAYCTGLTEVDLPLSVTTIRGFAFEDCSSLTELQIPSSVTAIGRSAFYGCSSLKRLRMPSDVTKVGEEAFEGVLLEHLELVGSRLSRAVAVRLRKHVVSNGTIVGCGLVGRRFGLFGRKILAPDDRVPDSCA
jgi:hypothetical protein